MKTITSTLPIEVVSKIEAVAYELEARKDVISTMLEKNMDCTTDAFIAYQTELVRYKAEYEALKAEIQKTYVDVIEGAHDWKLDYASCVLAVNVVEK